MQLSAEDTVIQCLITSVLTARQLGVSENTSEVQTKSRIHSCQTPGTLPNMLFHIARCVVGVTVAIGLSYLALVFPQVCAINAIDNNCRAHTNSHFQSTAPTTMDALLAPLTAPAGTQIHKDWPEKAMVVVPRTPQGIRRCCLPPNGANANHPPRFRPGSMGSAGKTWLHLLLPTSLHHGW